MVKDLFDEPFDEGTLEKLAIFENYAEAWLPTFVMQRRRTICIFDFFAGTGKDMDGVYGSPLRILRQVSNQLQNIRTSGIKVHVYFNAYDPKRRKSEEKFALLTRSCEEFIAAVPGLRDAVETHYYNEDCSTLFWSLLSEIRLNPSLVYLDQNGVKFLADKYLLALERLNETDFLYYASSSYFWRLGDSPEFKAHVELDMDALKRGGYDRVHCSVIEQLKRKLPHDTRLRLYPFSIRKDHNIFGIIFGAKHPLAVDKFLSLSWKQNAVNGAANFDIDGDAGFMQMDLFAPPKIKKVDQFKMNVREKVLSGHLKSNLDVLEYAYSQGHIASHAKEALMAMKASGEIAYDAKFPLVSYDSVYGKSKRVLTYTILKARVKAA